MNNRRNFLKSFGLSLGAALTTGSVTSTASESIMNTKRIGVLLPTSTKYPEYPESFLNGLNLVLDELSAKGSKIELVTEMVKFGYTSQAVRKTKKLIESNRVGLIIGLLNTNVAYHVGEITREAKIPTYIANAGENSTGNELAGNPFLNFSTLNLCRNSLMAGKFMVDNFGKRLAVVCGLYDSGYDSINAFRQGVETSGGSISEVFTDQQVDSDFNERTLTQIKQQEFDGIFILMNGPKAYNFLRTVKNKKLTVPIMTTSFVADENQLIHAGETMDNVYHLGSWSTNLEGEENKKFVSDYKNEFYTNPDQFSYLGYQTGLILKSQQNKRNLTAGELSLQSPVGKIKFDLGTGCTTESPVYVCKTVSGHFSSPQNVILEKIRSEDDHTETTLDQDTNNIHSGWLNPYLFV
ncbi:ABC transporter substrate-binding protein [Maribellus mangrovi]|uniref:ABC transporter substrate-binding protein n=1 Tax=Maribellus mangrovi TaxID=3133146 RepID=UPI0030ED09F9